MSLPQMFATAAVVFAIGMGLIIRYEAYDPGSYHNMEKAQRAACKQMGGEFVYLRGEGSVCLSKETILGRWR